MPDISQTALYAIAFTPAERMREHPHMPAPDDSGLPHFHILAPNAPEAIERFRNSSKVLFADEIISAVPGDIRGRQILITNDARSDDDRLFNITVLVDNRVKMRGEKERRGPAVKNFYVLAVHVKQALERFETTEAAKYASDVVAVTPAGIAGTQLILEEVEAPGDRAVGSGLVSLN